MGLLVDQRFWLVLGGCHCLEQKKPGRTEWNRRSTGQSLGGPVLMSSLRAIGCPLKQYEVMCTQAGFVSRLDSALTTDSAITGIKEVA